MKRKFLPALLLVGSLFFTACQEDDTMDELIQDTNSVTFEDGNGSGGTNGGSGAGDDKPGGN